jgi:hypothetical protein
LTDNSIFFIGEKRPQSFITLKSSCYFRAQDGEADQFRYFSPLFDDILHMLLLGGVRMIESVAVCETRGATLLFVSDGADGLGLFQRFSNGHPPNHA